MPRGIRKKTRQYVLERFQEEDPESYFKYKAQSSRGLSHEEMEFLEALNNKSVNVIKSFLNRGLDPNFTILPGGHTPLHQAIMEHKPEDTATEKIIRGLLFFGCDPNAQDQYGNSPLHTACFAKSFLGGQLLLQAGAKVNCENWNQETPLMCACSLKEPCPAMVELLVENGAHTDVTNKGQQNVLHLLCSSDLCRPCDFLNRAKVAQYLLDRGMPSNSVDSNGKTPLCYEFLRLVYVFSTSVTVDDARSLRADTTKVALTLVKAGGLSNFRQHTDDLISFIDTLSLFPQGRPVLLSFFLTTRSCLPLSQYNQVCNWVAKPKHTIFSLHAEGHLVVRGVRDISINNDNDDDDNNDDDNSIVNTGATASRRHHERQHQQHHLQHPHPHHQRHQHHQRHHRGDGRGGGQETIAAATAATDEVADNISDADIDDDKSLYERLVWSSPPSLLSIAKVVIRRRLGGRVLVNAKLLGLPSKMGAYITSLH